MHCEEPFVDIHCHMLPGLDDGAPGWPDSLAMARIAWQDGIRTTIVTPHQLGTYGHIRAAQVRSAATRLQDFLADHDVPLQIRPGADVRVAAELLGRLRQGDVLTLADRNRHVLLELPHEMYISLDRCLDQLQAAGLVGILSHPERNFGLIRRPDRIPDLVRQGCLMQVTTGSLLGTFGPRSQQLAERMVREGWVHFLATDAHGARARRPLMQRAYQRVVELADAELATDLCCRFPACVVRGEDVPAELPRSARRSFAQWLPWRRAA